MTQVLEQHPCCLERQLRQAQMKEISQSAGVAADLLYEEVQTSLAIYILSTTTVCLCENKNFLEFPFSLKYVTDQSHLFNLSIMHWSLNIRYLNKIDSSELKPVLSSRSRLTIRPKIIFFAKTPIEKHISLKYWCTKA